MISFQESIFIYDREYKLVNKEYSAVNYINNEAGENKLRIRFDPNFFYLTGFTLDTINKKNQQFKFSAMYTDNNNVLVAFVSNDKVPIQLSYKDSINSHITFEGTYDEEANPMDISVKIEKNSTLITLTSHPVFSNVYVDENGNEYRLSNQDFSRLSGMASFSPYILKNISNTLVKKK